MGVGLGESVGSGTTVGAGETVGLGIGIGMVIVGSTAGVGVRDGFSGSSPGGVVVTLGDGTTVVVGDGVGDVIREFCETSSDVNANAITPVDENIANSIVMRVFLDICTSLSVKKVTRTFR